MGHTVEASNHSSDMGNIITQNCPGASQRSPEIQKAIDFVNSVIAKGEPFVDDEFPPCQDSLATLNCRDNSGRYETYIGYQWRRSSEIFDDPEVFKDGASYDDIEQGQFGDCYFCAALASAAEVPERIERRFLTTEMNECGIYAMTFFVNGVETPVIVDDYFPCEGR